MKPKTRIVRLAAAGLLAACATTLFAGSASASAVGPGGGGGIELGVYTEPQCYYLGNQAVASGKYSTFSCAFDHLAGPNLEFDQLWVA
ncbi:hypothetical protein [Streptomyces broussonetiae]|uniref:Uncharacterized protein n=1 Tax=Streptomyces broussonetiae TaxID=2686304 RepID=A0A6I6MZA1_9ACTN|nr:hypothetical protein [Streptomyces broussonetiae]QHA02387.1 hypothetical protein GQF42_02945 [Streptomyces broussonetiae]